MFLYTLTRHRNRSLEVVPKSGSEFIIRKIITEYLAGYGYVLFG